jgi:phage/plasmid-like protein (TIGR03299 family)
MPFKFVAVPNRKAIYASDNGHVFGIFKDGYVPHQFGDVLLGNVVNLIDDTVHIQSAGLLKQRAVAWVQIGIPDTMKTPEGVDYRPRLIATTGHDGTVATTYKRVSTIVVCDNTRDMAMSEKGNAFKIKRTKYSQFKLATAREALDLIHADSDEFAAEVKALCETSVTDQQFDALVSTLVPITDQTGKAGITKAENKRDQLHALWVNDNRVSPWRGNAFGALQAFNTWGQHERGTRGGTVTVERNMFETISGDVAKSDALVLDTLGKILSNA